MVKTRVRKPIVGSKKWVETNGVNGKKRKTPQFDPSTDSSDQENLNKMYKPPKRSNIEDKNKSIKIKSYSNKTTQIRIVTLNGLLEK